MNKVQEYAVKHGVKNVLSYGAVEEKSIFERQASEVGYNRISTFYSDLSIAEWFGLNNVRDTYKNVVKSWLNNYKMFTEFVLCLNWKSWEWNARGYDELCQLYVELYEQAQDLFYEHYKGNKEAQHYYFEVTDEKNNTNVLK